MTTFELVHGYTARMIGPKLQLEWQSRGGSSRGHASDEVENAIRLHCDENEQSTVRAPESVVSRIIHRLRIKKMPDPCPFPQRNTTANTHVRLRNAGFSQGC